jgi:hypothetical protein
VQLVNENDTLDDLNYYAEYVITDVAIKMLVKQEDDPSVFIMQKQALEKRIRDKAANRDAAVADTISDASAENDWWYWRPGCVSQDPSWTTPGAHWKGRWAETM